MWLLEEERMGCSDEQGEVRKKKTECFGNSCQSRAGMTGGEGLCMVPHANTHLFKR